MANLPKRSECVCSCHAPGSVIMHAFPCCQPDDNATHYVLADPIDPNATPLSILAGRLEQEILEFGGEYPADLAAALIDELERNGFEIARKKVR